MEAQLVQTLQASLSPAAETRLAAEQALEQALANPDIGSALARIVLADEVELPVRQTAGVILKKFMDRWWDVLGEGLSEEAKNQLLQLLFQALSLSSSKLRSQSAHSLSVALLTSTTSVLVLPPLLQILASPESSTELVHGAMRVFQEGVRKGDLDLGGGVEGDERVLGVVRGLGPVLLGVLGNETHSPSTRASTIAVYRQCLSTTYMLKDTLPTLANATVEDVLPPWLSAFQVLLAQPSQPLDTAQGWESLKIHREIYKTLDAVFRTFGRSLTTKIVAELLPLTLAHLERLLPSFAELYVSSMSDATPPALESSDEEVTIETVVCPIIDFLTEVSRAGKLRAQWVGLGSKLKPTKGRASLNSLGGEAEEEGKETDELRRAIRVVLNFTVLTTEDEDNWLNDPNAFVADEDDETDMYSLRIASHDFISTLLEKYPKPAARVLQSVVRETIDGARTQQGSQPDWWKPLEASLALVGGVSEVLLETLEEEESLGLAQKSFDLGYIFDQIIPGFLGAKDFPFLQGRSFVVASQYATALAPSLASQYLSAAVQVLEAAELGVSVKLSSVKTIKNFCRHLPIETVKPMSHQILSNLVPLVLQAGDEVLALVLESLRSILGVDETALDGPLTGQLVDVMLQVWAKNARDPVISSIFEEIFEHLATTPNDESYNALMTTALPKLCTLINAFQPQDAESSIVAAGAIELIANVLRGRKGPLDPNGQGFTAGIGGVLFPALINGDDMEVTQNGVEALILLIRKDCETLLTSNIAATGESGLQSTFAVIARLLRPTESESRGLFLGDLIVHLLRNAGPAVAPVLPELVKAIVERIPTATYTTFQQSLIVPIAYLIHTQFDAIVPLLESLSIVPPSSSTAVSGLEILLKAWTETAMEIHGSWAIRVSSLALGDLLASNRPSLEHIRVRGEMIINQSNAEVIMTRSRTKTTPTQYSSTPFNVKALKLLVAEAGAAKLSGDYNASWEQDAEDDDEDDDDDEGAEWEDDGPAFLKGGPKPVDEFGFLSDMLGAGGVDDTFGDDDDDDDDLADDPISQLDMQAHLTGLLRRTYAEHDGFGALAGALSQDEMATLGSLLS